MRTYVQKYTRIFIILHFTDLEGQQLLDAINSKHAPIYRENDFDFEIIKLIWKDFHREVRINGTDDIIEGINTIANPNFTPAKDEKVLKKVVKAFRAFHAKYNADNAIYGIRSQKYIRSVINYHFET